MEMNEFNQIMETMKYYENEFLERQKSFWQLLTRFFTLEVIVVLLPFVSTIAGITLDSAVKPVVIIFPIFGIVFAILTLLILSKEGKRIILVNLAKYYVNVKLPGDSQYRKDIDGTTIQPDESKRSHWLSTWIPWMVFSVELVMSIFSLVFCFVLL